MSTDSCLNSSQSHFSKFIIDDHIDGTRITQNFSKFCQNCKLVKDDLEVEIFSLKNKAHQSFMQVIQVQQLHEEQLQLMKQQHQEQISALKQQNENLHKHVSKTKEQLLAMQKNSKHHIFEVQQSSFLIENIDIIQCNEDDGKQSKLDESSYVQFNQFVQEKISKKNDNFLRHRVQEINRSKQSNQKLERLSSRIQQLQAEVQSLWQTNQQLKKQCVKQQNMAQTFRKNYDSLYKQTKFMSDHIRNLSNDKFKLQRKIKECQKQIRELKNKSVVNSVKRSTTWEQECQPQIKISSSGLFASQEFQTVRNSLDNSRQQKDNEENSTFVLQSLNFQDATKPRSSGNVMLKSDMFTSNQQKSSQQEPRKTLPNYKKISHIPSFKKATSDRKVSQKTDDFLLIKQQNFEQSQKSGFMDQIRKQIQAKMNTKKSSTTSSQQQTKPSIFKEINKKRI